MSLSNIKAISFFGYYSSVNKSVRLVEDAGEDVCSAHVLLEKGADEKNGMQIELNLPQPLIKNAFGKN